MLRAWTESMARLIAARSVTGPGRHDDVDLVVEDDETEGVGGGEAVDDVAQGALGVVERLPAHRPAAVEDDHQVGGGRVLGAVRAGASTSTSRAARSARVSSSFIQKKRS